MAHRSSLLLLLAMASCTKVLSQDRVDDIPFHDLFRLEVLSYEAEKFIHVEPEELKTNPVLGPQLNALSNFYAYLYENYTGMYRHQSELLALLPDEVALQQRFDELMDTDADLRSIYLRPLRKEKVDALPLDSALRIAAHFFYVHRMQGKVTMHVCIGINEVQEMSASTAHPYHAAFCYMAIWGMKDFMGLFESAVDPYRAELKADPTDERLQEIEELVYEALAHDPKLRKVVLKEYARKAKYLNFELIR